jgi:hypothetical protein
LPKGLKPTRPGFKLDTLFVNVAPKAVKHFTAYGLRHDPPREARRGGALPG